MIHMKDEVFGKLRRGQQNPMTGFMTGKIKVDGDVARPQAEGPVSLAGRGRAAGLSYAVFGRGSDPWGQTPYTCVTNGVKSVARGCRKPGE